MRWHLRFILCFGPLPEALGLPSLCGGVRFSCVITVFQSVSGESVLHRLHVSCAVVWTLVLQGGPAFEAEVTKRENVAL